MRELAALEAKHLEQRRNVDGKLIRVQQSKAFFMEEVAQAARRQAGAQVTALRPCHLRPTGCADSPPGLALRAARFAAAAAIVDAGRLMLLWRGHVGGGRNEW